MTTSKTARGKQKEGVEDRARERERVRTCVREKGEEAERVREKREKVTLSTVRWSGN